MLNMISNTLVIIYDFSPVNFQIPFLIAILLLLLVVVVAVSLLKQNLFKLVENNDILLVKSSNRIGLFNFFKKF